MEFFNSLPVDITSDILARLPTEQVLECKSVCKAWGSLVSQPSFSQVHLQRLNHSSTDDSGKKGFLAVTTNSKSTNSLHYFEYIENHELTTPIQRIRRMNFKPPLKSYKFVGSCKGLICLSQGTSVCICNPITRECVVLPEIKTDCDHDQYFDRLFEFGCVSFTNEYKVVGIHVLKTEFVEVHIYTLGSGVNGWRNLGKFNPQFGIRTWEQGIFANGALYWMGCKLEMIVTFDLADEKFLELFSPPPLSPDSDWMDYGLGVLDSFLSFRVGVYVNNTEYFDIWLLKKKNDIHDKKEGEEYHSLGWSKEFRVDNAKLLAYTKSDDVLTYDYDYLYIYGTKTSTSKSLVMFKNWILKVLPHKNTLVSLKELGEEHIKAMESVEIEETGSCDDPFKKLQENADSEYIYL